MNQKHLLRFIKNKMKYNAEDIVCRDSEGREMSLEQVRQCIYRFNLYESLKLKSHTKTTPLFDIGCATDHIY